MVEGRSGASRDRPRRSPSGHHTTPENERRLLALGDAIDQKNGSKRSARSRRRFTNRRRTLIITGVVVIALALALLGGGYFYAKWRFDQIPRINVAGEYPPISGQAFNILSIGSDSRAGLTGLAARQTGASSGSVSGQRSDVVKIVHIDPAHGSITILSIPRDTMVTLLANQSLYGKFNRINVNYQNGPSLLVRTITANFGIRIRNVIQVSFAGLINAANSIGGVYLDFRYPAADPYSGLRIPHTGCQLVTGFEALAVARSRHYYYNVEGHGQWPGNNASYSKLESLGWRYDGTSDFGRIDRQDAFLRALFSRVKGLYNPITLNSFLSKIPQGITLDSNFSFGEMVGLALKFHGLNPAAIRTYTLPTIGATDPAVGDVLFVDQPAAQKMLVSIFGGSLVAPTNPPPNTQLHTPAPPKVTVTTVAPTSATSTGRPSTATTNPTDVSPPFDPVPCVP